MFLRSPSPDGVLVFGITVTYSFFHILGQLRVPEIVLYIEVRGTARKSAY